jgi:hypothetical protein
MTGAEADDAVSLALIVARRGGPLVHCCRDGWLAQLQPLVEPQLGQA